MGTFFICSIMLLLPTLIITKLTPIKTLKFEIYSTGGSLGMITTLDIRENLMVVGFENG